MTPDGVRVLSGPGEFVPPERAFLAPYMCRPGSRIVHSVLGRRCDHAVYQVRVTTALPYVC